jgi:hypothetical protein
VLTPDRIKPLLFHDDPTIRRAAIDYFADSWSRDADLIPTMLEVSRRFGDEANFDGLWSCTRFPVTGPALDQVLEHLSGTENAEAIGQLNRVLIHAPGELLMAREQAIGERAKLLPGTAPRLDRRRDFAGWSGEKLWEELQDFARRSEEKHHTGELDLSYADDLIDALARHDLPDAATLCEMLRALEPEQGWLEIFLVDLAGERRIAGAIPALVGKFHIDTDYLLERSKEALAKIGGPESIRLLREAYPTASDHFKIYTSGIFGRIKLPESEEAILALLETEENPTHRTIMYTGLCDLFSRRGVEVVRREIESGYDRRWTSLEERLLPVAEVLGVELPEAERWKQERDERERGVARRRAEWEALAKQFEALKAKGIDPFARLERAMKQTAEPKPPEPKPPAPIAIDPIRRSGRKIGRNDPCPCGSGKKFKKCCGRGG